MSSMIEAKVGKLVEAKIASYWDLDSIKIMTELFLFFTIYSYLENQVLELELQTCNS
jgi:hypothetical protein